MRGEMRQLAESTLRPRVLVVCDPNACGGHAVCCQCESLCTTLHVCCPSVAHSARPPLDKTLQKYLCEIGLNENAEEIRHLRELSGMDFYYQVRKSPMLAALLLSVHHLVSRCVATT